MAKSDQKPVSFDRLWHDKNWQQIPNCPGRYRLADRQSGQSPAELIGEQIEVQEYKVPVCRDVVLVAELNGGGLISYRQSNGTFVHTLNTSDGFARKLEQLGIS